MIAVAFTLVGAILVLAFTVALLIAVEDATDGDEAPEHQFQR